MDIEPKSAAGKLALALDMFDTGLAIKTAQLRRRNPDATEDELHAAIVAWLFERSDREFDAPGLLPSRS